MTDVHSPLIRSKNMRAITSKNTKPELLVRRTLHSSGFRFRLHRTDLPGKPDMVLPKYRTVVLVHGCFWHQHPGCRFAVMPVTRRSFWQNKLEGNVVRDERQITALETMGWKVFVIWECQVKNTYFLEEIMNNMRERLKD